MRLLIADDEAVIRRGLSGLDWASIGIDEVYSACNGEEAREIMLSRPVDVGIFDIKMPGMTGLELAELVNKEALDMAVILLTGFSEFAYAQSALRSGVYDYLLKPLNPRELLSTVQAVMARLAQERRKRNAAPDGEKREGALDTVRQMQREFSKVSGSVQEVLLTVAREFSRPISLTELSERSYFSSSYMSKKIRQETGYSFIEILNAVRLMNAAVFLQEDERVNLACEKAGFNDQRYFSQIFKKVFGVSPRDYKKEEHSPGELRLHMVLEQVVGRNASEA